MLYRNGKASFIEETLQLRKLGLDSEIPFKVYQFQFEPGDVLILGSDGRDDVNLTPDAEVRNINEDEFLFLKHVERGEGGLDRIESEIRKLGELTDDLSLLRVGFQEQVLPGTTRAAPIQLDAHDVYDERVEAHVNDLYERGRNHYRQGNLEAAIKTLQEGYEIDQANARLNKLLGLLSFKGRDYKTAVEVLNRYLGGGPEETTIADATELESWIALSLAEKRRGNYADAERAAEAVFRARPDEVRNLVNLADLKRLRGDLQGAGELAERARALKADDPNLERLLDVLSGESTGSR